MRELLRRSELLEAMYDGLERRCMAGRRTLVEAGSRGHKATMTAGNDSFAPTRDLEVLFSASSHSLVRFWCVNQMLSNTLFFLSALPEQRLEAKRDWAGV